MSLGIYILDRRGREIAHLSDDREESFRRLCQASPWDSLRRGVMTHGETTFNRVQLMHLVEELEAVPGDRRTPVVDRVIELSKVAITESSYLHLTGD
ncbi:hypothetical protein OG588_28705 [Streptomyces prunicolor]|uniref:hypothetical protein n=1 Tax=Streptomyces prunicolor TaxID=67348 RepID=UPI0038690155|nr:hypothetical protein OG588_28705 [Streptomyces prunicolor]